MKSIIVVSMTRPCFADRFPLMPAGEVLERAEAVAKTRGQDLLFVLISTDDGLTWERWGRHSDGSWQPAPLQTPADKRTFSMYTGTKAVSKDTKPFVPQGAPALGVVRA